MADNTVTTSLNIESIVQDVLGTIEREREREIIARRFGLFDRKETLEQIGELLGITRERVRQLEKAVITKLQAAGEDLPRINEVQAVLGEQLAELGHVARTAEITKRLAPENTKIDQSRVAFLAHLAPKIAVIDDNDHFFHSIGLATKHNEKAIRDHVGKVIDAINQIGQPTNIESLAREVGNPDTKQAAQDASKQASQNANNSHVLLFTLPLLSCSEEARRFSSRQKC